MAVEDRNMNETGLSWSEKRHNSKVQKAFDKIAIEIKERKARGEVIEEITVPDWMFFYEMIPIDEAIEEAEAELHRLEAGLHELKEEGEWQKLCD